MNTGMCCSHTCACTHTHSRPSFTGWVYVVAQFAFGDINSEFCTFFLKIIPTILINSQHNPHQMCVLVIQMLPPPPPKKTQTHLDTDFLRYIIFPLLSFIDTLYFSLPMLGHSHAESQRGGRKGVGGGGVEGGWLSVVLQTGLHCLSHVRFQTLCLTFLPQPLALTLWLHHWIQWPATWHNNNNWSNLSKLTVR